MRLLSKGGENSRCLVMLMLKSRAMGNDLEAGRSYIQLAFIGPLLCARCCLELGTEVNKIDGVLAQSIVVGELEIVSK